MTDDPTGSSSKSGEIAKLILALVLIGAAAGIYVKTRPSPTEQAQEAVNSTPTGPDAANQPKLLPGQEGAFTMTGLTESGDALVITGTSWAKEVSVLADGKEIGKTTPAGDHRWQVSVKRAEFEGKNVIVRELKPDGKTEDHPTERQVGIAAGRGG